MSDPTPVDVVAQAKAEAAKVEKPQTTVGPMAEVAPGQREIAGAITRKLAESNEGVAAVVGTMIASRQLYAMASRDLEVQMGAIKDKDRRKIFDEVVEAMEVKPEGEFDPLETFDLVEEMLVQSSAYAAAKPFNENILFRGIRETVLPWMVKTVDRHNVEAANQRKEELDAWEEARRERPVPLGVKYDHEGGDTLERTRSLVLYGWRPAVMWVIDQIVTHVLASKGDQLFTVLRLMTHLGKVQARRQLIRVGGKDWEGCCKSSTSWPKVFQAKVLKQLSDPIDLMVIDDLAHAGKSSGIIGGSKPRMAGNAQKRFRDWATKVGSAIVAAVPLDEKEPISPAGIEWEQLRTFTTLRPVWVQEEGEKYKIIVGKDASFHFVNKEILDSYTGSSIIVDPSGSKKGIVS